MLKLKGFTMVELMIVIVIVAILSSVAVPMMRSRIERAKYTEGMAGCSAIATALRSYIAEHSEDVGFDATTLTTPGALGFVNGDLQGKYFAIGNYGISGITYSNAAGLTAYTITATAPTGLTLGNLALDESGDFTLGTGADAQTF